MKKSNQKRYLTTTKDLEIYLGRFLEIRATFQKESKNRISIPQQKEEYSSIELANFHLKEIRALIERKNIQDKRIKRLELILKRLESVLIHSLPDYTWIKVGDKAIGKYSDAWGGTNWYLVVIDWGDHRNHRKLTHINYD